MEIRNCKYEEVEESFSLLKPDLLDKSLYIKVLI